MEILVVCGAGASSAFVAHRLRLALAESGIPASVSGSTEAGLAGDLPRADLVLIGAHLSAQYESIRDRAASHGAHAQLLPPDVAGDLDGRRTRDQVTDWLATLTPSDERRPS